MPLTSDMLLLLSIRSEACYISVSQGEWLPGGGTLGVSRWERAAGTLKLLAYTRASSVEFCYPILEQTTQITPNLD